MSLPFNIKKSTQTSIMITFVILKYISIVSPCFYCLLVALYDHRHLEIPFRYTGAVHTLISYLFLVLKINIRISCDYFVVLKSTYFEPISYRNS